MYSLLTIRRLAASSSSAGLLVAPMTRILAIESVPTPSNCTKNSVLSRLDVTQIHTYTYRDASFSVSDLHVNNESISSMKMIDGLNNSAIENNDLTSFSPSPI